MELYNIIYVFFYTCANALKMSISEGTMNFKYDVHICDFHVEITI